MPNSGKTTPTHYAGTGPAPQRSTAKVTPPAPTTGTTLERGISRVHLPTQRGADRLRPAAADWGTDLRAAGVNLNLPLAHGDVAASVIDATVVAHDPMYGLAQVAFDGGMLWLPHAGSAIGRRVRVRIQARDVSLALGAQGATSVLNILPATVVELADDGPAQVMVGLAIGQARLLARITRKSRDALALAPGSRVHAQVKGVAILD